jgi:hypothetical protein
MSTPTSSDSQPPPVDAPTSEPPEPRSPRRQWDDCRQAIWKAEALAKMFAEMSSATEQFMSDDDELRYEYLWADDLRIYADMLVDQLEKAAENIGELEPSSKEGAS